MYKVLHFIKKDTSWFVDLNNSKKEMITELAIILDVLSHNSPKVSLEIITDGYVSQEFIHYKKLFPYKGGMLYGNLEPNLLPEMILLGSTTLNLFNSYPAHIYMRKIL